jgi:hypothetical protein
VLGPPCIRQRPFAIAGPRHEPPSRRRAPHRWRAPAAVQNIPQSTEKEGDDCRVSKCRRSSAGIRLRPSSRLAARCPWSRGVNVRNEQPGTNLSSCILIAPAWCDISPVWALCTLLPLRDLRATALRWTGIPTCVGVGPTKTLAKLANNAAWTTVRCAFRPVVLGQHRLGRLAVA